MTGTVAAAAMCQHFSKKTQLPSWKSWVQWKGSDGNMVFVGWRTLGSWSLSPRIKWTNVLRVVVVGGMTFAHQSGPSSDFKRGRITASH